MPEQNGSQKEWEKFHLETLSEKDLLLRNKALGRKQPISLKKLLALKQRKEQLRQRRGGV